jgi:hypothetical protein
MQGVRMSVIPPQTISIAPGSGKVLSLQGITYKLSTQTGGAYYLFECDHDSGGGTILQVHRHEDEVVYVLKGEVEIRLASQRMHAAKCGVAHLPKNIPMNDNVLNQLSLKYGIEWLE